MLTLSLIKQPSAWIPIAMSFVALVFTIGYLSVFGISQNQQEDEGLAARIFQLLMVGQVPIIVYFAFRWFPKKPNQALLILVLQILAALIAFSSVFFLEL